MGRRTHNCTETQKHTLENCHWLICPTFPRMLADLGWGSFFSCISLSHSLFLLPLTAHDRVSPHLSPLKHNALKSLFNPLPPNSKRFNGLIHKLPCLLISVHLNTHPWFQSLRFVCVPDQVLSAQRESCICRRHMYMCVCVCLCGCDRGNVGHTLDAYNLLFQNRFSRVAQQRKSMTFRSSYAFYT